MYATVGIGDRPRSDIESSRVGGGDEFISYSALLSLISSSSFSESSKSSPEVKVFCKSWFPELPFSDISRKMLKKDRK